MIDRFRVVVVSAEASLFSGDATFVLAPLSDGDAGFLPGHSPLLGRLRAGALRIKDAAGVEQAFYVSGGFVEVQPSNVTVLADSSERAGDIDEARAAKAVQDAERLAEERLGQVDYARAQSELDQALARLKVVRAYRSQSRGFRPDQTR